MSSTEKLKALSVSRAIDWPAPSYEAYRLAEDQERLRKNAIDRAFPQIVAVVEAAESAVLLEYDPARHQEINEELGRRATALRSALAALEEVLTADGKTPK